MGGLVHVPASAAGPRPTCQPSSTASSPRHTPLYLLSLLGHGSEPAAVILPGPGAEPPLSEPPAAWEGLSPPPWAAGLRVRTGSAAAHVWT